MSEETQVEATEETPAVEEPKKEMSYTELMETLKDPALLKAAAEKQGLSVVKPEAQRPAAVEVPQTAYEEIEITEDMEPTQAAMARQFNKKLKGMADSINQQVSAAQQASEQKQTVRDADRQRAEINKFADGIGGITKLEEVASFLKPMFLSEDSPTCGDIAASYEAARRAMGLPTEGEQTETKPKETETAPKKKKASSVKSSEQSEALDTQELTDKPMTYREAVKAAGDEVLAGVDGDPFKTEE